MLSNVRAYMYVGSAWAKECLTRTATRRLPTRGRTVGSGVGASSDDALPYYLGLLMTMAF